MRESPTDLAELQRVLDDSHAAGGEHLRSIFDVEHRVTAAELVQALGGIFEMHLATVTAAGDPLVAPLDGILFQGKIWFGLPAGSVRSRVVRRDPRVSASYTNGSFAFIVHGTAREVESGTAPEAQYDLLVRELYVAVYGPGWIDWYERRRREDPAVGFTGWIEPRRMFAKR